MNNQIVLLILLCCYIFSIYVSGRYIVHILLPSWKQTIVVISTSLLMGTLIAATLTYIFSCIFSRTTEPILYGELLYICFVFVIFLIRKIPNKDIIPISEKYIWDNKDLLVSGIIFIIGLWIMNKTLHTGIDGTWLVSSNTVFDSAHAITLIRSFSWGNNIPFSSPFAAGVQEMYHFLFYYLIACFERLGIPLITSLNFISAYGFSMFLLMTYVIVRYLLQLGIIPGVLTILLILSNSSLTWIYFFYKEGFNFQILGKAWHLQQYIFAGPFDGSIISLFFTLNVFVNQRHLGMTLGILLFFWIVGIQIVSKHTRENTIKVLILGFLIGCLSIWHSILYFVAMGSNVLIFLLHRRFRHAFILTATSLFVGLFFLFPYTHDIFIYTRTIPSVQHVNTISSILYLFEYWIINLGMLIPLSIIGITQIPKKYSNSVKLTIITWFIFICVFLLLNKNEIVQKIINYWMVFVSISAIYGFVYLFNKTKLNRVFIIIIFITTILSGLLNVMVIKNDYQYPAYPLTVQQQGVLFNTRIPNQAVILSYKEMFHSISLSGRRQYNGFFSPPNALYREAIAASIWNASNSAILVESVKQTPITHIIIPKKEMVDFPYKSDISLFKSTFKVLFETDDNIVFLVSK